MTRPTRLIRLLTQASLAALMLAIPATATAQIVHSVSFGAGISWPKGFDSRATGDVLVANLTQPVFAPDLYPGVTSALEFEIGDFRSYPVFGEWHLGLTSQIEVGVGLGFYNKKVDSRYRDLVNSARNFEDIQQTLRIRAVPITGVLRFLPSGDASSVQPYAGAGVAIIPFRYTETGEFVDLNDVINLPIFNDQFEVSKTAVGGVLLAGVRLPMGGDIYAFNIEGRYLFAKGDTGGETNGFLGDKFDLGGGSLNFSFLIRF